MKVTYKAGVDLFKAMGIPASAWTPERLRQKMCALPGFLKDNPDKKKSLSAPDREMLEDVVAAVANGSLTVVPDGGNPKYANGQDHGKAGKPSNGAPHREPDPLDDEEPEEIKKAKKKEKKVEKKDSAVAPPNGKKPHAGKKVAEAPKAGKARDRSEGFKETVRAGAAVDRSKPGVVRSIIEFLAKAGKDRPLTKDQLEEMLAKRFPERPRKSMRSTINSHVPCWIKVTKGITISIRELKSGKRGYWIEPKELKALGNKSPEVAATLKGAARKTAPPEKKGIAKSGQGKKKAVAK